MSNLKAMMMAALMVGLLPGVVVPDPEIPLPAFTLTEHLPFSSGMTLTDNWADQDQEKLLDDLKHFDRIGIENKFKMHHIQPEIGRFEWGAIDAFLNFARRINKRVFVHTLMWADVNAADLRAKKGVWTAAQFEAFLRTHIRTVLEHLKPWMDIIDGFDVVNEAFGPSRVRTDTNQKKADGTENTYYSFWGSVLPDFIYVAFDEFNKAKTGKPGFINDFVFETSNAKPVTVVNYIKALAARGCKVDGVGSQTHAPADLNWADVEKRFKTFSDAGVILHISELDVKMKRGVTKANGYPEDVPGWTNAEITFGDPPKVLNTPELENVVLKARPKLEAAHSFFYTRMYTAYMRSTKPSLRFGVTHWSRNDKVSHLNKTSAGYADFPTMQYHNGTWKPVLEALLKMPIIN